MSTLTAEQKACIEKVWEKLTYRDVEEYRPWENSDEIFHVAPAKLFDHCFRKPLPLQRYTQNKYVNGSPPMVLHNCVTNGNVTLCDPKKSFEDLEKFFGKQS